MVLLLIATTLLTLLETITGVSWREYEQARAQKIVENSNDEEKDNGPEHNMDPKDGGDEKNKSQEESQEEETKEDINDVYSPESSKK